MRVALLTTHPISEESHRIATEVKDLGHKFALIDHSQHHFEIHNDELEYSGITDLEADVVITRGIFTNIRTWQPLAKYLRERGIRVFDNNLSHHLYAINKVVDLVKLALAQNIPLVDTITCKIEKEVRQAAKELGYPMVIKSTRMGKGAGVFKVDNEDELDGFISGTTSENKPFAGLLFQRFFPYELDLRVLIIGSQTFCMRRIPKKGDFRANFSLGGSVEPYQPGEEIKNLALRALAAVDMEVAGVDVLVDKKGQMKILEVNHTPGFVGMETALKANIGKVYVEHALEAASLGA